MQNPPFRRVYGYRLPIGEDTTRGRALFWFTDIMKNKFNVVLLDGSIAPLEFGTVKHVPFRQFDGCFATDALVYIKGLNGSKDVYLPILEGFHIRPGVVHPEFQEPRLRSSLMVGDEVCFVRHSAIRARFWGMTRFYDQAVFSIAERPVYRLHRTSQTMVNSHL